MRGARIQLALERADEGREEIEEQTLARQHDVAQVVLHEGAENDRPHALLRGSAIDAADRLLCLVNARYEWQSHRPKFEPVELREQTVTHRLCRHARLVRDEKYGSAAHVSESFIARAAEQVACP
jgi:hypothetical protein